MTADPQPTRTNPHIWTWLWLAGLLVLPLLVHGGSIRHPFLIDDHDAIVSHPDVTNVGGLATLWTHDYWAGRTEDPNLYRPVTVLSFWLNFRAVPDPTRTPGIFRIVNLLMLGGVGVGLLLLLKRHVGITAAGLAAGLFVVHPLHGEVINHLVGRADLLAVLGIVGFIAVQDHALRRGWTKRGIALAALFAVVALGSKESGYALVPVSLLQWWLHPLSPRERAGVRGEAEKVGDNKKVPDTFSSADTFSSGDSCGTSRGICRKRALLYALLLPTTLAIVTRVLVVGLGTDYTPGSDDLTGNPLRGMTFLERLPEACAIFFWNIKQLVWPSLTFNHTSAPSDLGGWSARAVVGGLLLIHCVVGVAWLTLSRKRRVIALAPALLLFHFLIVGNLLLPTGVYAANRLTVATAAAGTLALACGLGWLFKQSEKLRLTSTIAVGCVLLLAGGVTVMQQSAWSSELSRMEADAEAQPDNPIAQYWAGQAYLEADQTAKALPALEKASALAPQSNQARLGLANAALYVGRDDLAWRNFRALLNQSTYELEPADRLNAAMAAFNVGEYERAKQLARSLTPPMGERVLEAVKQIQETDPAAQ